MVRMVHAALDDNFAVAGMLNDWFAPFFKACFYETNPIPIKTAMAHMGWCSDIFRLPLTTMESEEKKASLLSIVDAMDEDIREGRI